jgi:hypothetical protein
MDVCFDDARMQSSLTFHRSLKTADTVVLPQANLTIQITRSEITRQKVEIVVNPADKLLHHVSPTSKAIRQAAGD